MACPPVALGRRVGSGANPKITIGAFLDICCPFSKRLYVRVTEDVIPHYEAKDDTKGQVVFIPYHYPQPWHPQGSALAEACIAVNEIDPDKYHKVVRALFDKYKDQFADELVIDKSKKTIFEEITEIAASQGVDKAALLDLLLGEKHDSVLVPILKFYARFGRQNGIHVTPTVTCNGLIAPNIESGWTLEQWTEYLDALLAKSNSVARSTV